jgi:hypothetical protein
MNARKAKSLRALARSTAVELVAYLPMRPQVIFGKMDIARKGPSAIWLGQCTLDPKCARAQYQQMKREARAT